MIHILSLFLNIHPYSSVTSAESFLDGEIFQGRSAQGVYAKQKLPLLWW